MAGSNESSEAVKVVIDAPVKDVDKSGLEVTPEAASSKRKVLVGAGFALVIVILGLSLGLGLGLGLRKNNDSDKSLSIDPSLRTYYIAADQVSWAYNGDKADDSESCEDPAMSSLQEDFHPVPSTKGGKFFKAMYREYTDASFKTLKERPASQKHLGLLGPLIYAEEGSTIQVVFKNNLPPSPNRPAHPAVNMEPSGGATWSTPQAGFLPAVLPGETAVYKWQITMGEGAANAASSSRLYLYRSSVNPTVDDNSGLVGPIIVTAKGQANPDGTTKGVDRDVVTLYQVYNENFSPFLTQNQQTVGKDVIITKMGVNGFTYCNLSGLDMVEGENVRWHVASVGSQLSTHNFHWHGNTLLLSGRRVDHMNLLGTNTASLDMKPDAVGKWLFHCHLNAHMKQGMQAVYTVKPAATPVTPAPLTGITRTYYIAAEEINWNYAPTDTMLCSGTPEPFSEDALVFLGPPEGIRIGSNYTKAVYKRYTDATFTTEIPRPANEQYMGLIGPIMRANVGDTIKVVFKNNLPKYYASMHPHGVLYDKASEGAPYLDGTSVNDKLDDMVAPGKIYTYTWLVPERSGPGPNEPSSKLWMYHSHVDEAADTSAGLLGGIVINKAGAIANTTAVAADGVSAPIPSDVDQEAFFFFNVVDEYASIYNVDNIQKYLAPELYNTTEALEQLYLDEAFRESSLKHAINGFMFCNMPVTNFTQFQRVRFHAIALGSQEDVHSPSIMGGTFLTLGSHSSSMVQLAGTMMTHDVVFTEPGNNLQIECRVADHVASGMEALYNVLPNPNPPNAIIGGKLRTFYIKAEKKVWDYAPKGYVKCTNQDFSASAQNYITPGLFQIGSKHLKALFVEYTDDTFTTPKARPDYMGMMGPVIGLEIGDTLHVVLKNDLDFDINFTPDGGFTALPIGTTSAVAPGERFTYKFIVPAEAGPLTGDLSTTSLLYVSNIDIPAHTAAGLLGVIVVARQGGLKEDGITPKDADLLLPLHFQVFNENASPLHEEWVAATIAEPNRELLVEDNNMMASINGFMYCNMPAPKIPQGSHVRVVFSAYGSEEGMFAPRILGQHLTVTDGAIASGQLLPAVSTPADVHATTPGDWPVVDDIHEHLDGGMIGIITVTPAPGQPHNHVHKLRRAVRL